MAELPGSLKPDRHRDLGESRSIAPWVRRAYIAVLLVLIVLALLGVFGQRTSSATSSAPGRATLTVDSPKRVRGGLLYQVHIIVIAHSTIDQPRLVLSREWFDGMQLNTSEPAALGEDSRQGAITFTYGGLAAGDRLDVFTQWQVNPTSKLGSRHPDVELDDGSRPITRVRHELTVLP
jgi:hypothetical protein